MYDELTAEREKSISINMPGLMKDVYAWMAIALVVTGFSAWFVADNALLRGLFMGSRTGTLVLIVATFALVWRLSSAMGKMSLKTAAVMFLVYSVLNGITLSAVFLTYTLSSIGGVFFMTARHLRHHVGVRLCDEGGFVEAGKYVPHGTFRHHPGHGRGFLLRQHPAADAYFLRRHPDFHGPHHL